MAFLVIAVPNRAKHAKNELHARVNPYVKGSGWFDDSILHFQEKYCSICCTASGFIPFWVGASVLNVE